MEDVWKRDAPKKKGYYDEKQRAVLIAKKKALDNESKQMRAMKLLSSSGGIPHFKNLAIENAKKQAIENKEGWVEEEDLGDFPDYDDDDDPAFFN